MSETGVFALKRDQSQEIRLGPASYQECGRHDSLKLNVPGVERPIFLDRDMISGLRDYLAEHLSKPSGGWNPDAPVSVGEETGPECKNCPSKPLLCVLAGAKRSEALLGCVQCGWPLSPETYKAGLERYAALGQAVVPESWK